MPAVIIDEDRARHIFRDAQGHFHEDNAANRQILLDVASRPANFRDTDRFGTDWFMETLSEGTQVWVHVRNGKITNGGLNPSPREFDEVI